MAAKKKAVETKPAMCANQTKVHDAAVKFLTDRFENSLTQTGDSAVTVALIQVAERLVFPKS